MIKFNGNVKFNVFITYMHDMWLPWSSFWSCLVFFFFLPQELVGYILCCWFDYLLYSPPWTCIVGKQRKVAEYYKKQESLLEGFNEMETMTETGGFPGTLTEVDCSITIIYIYFFIHEASLTCFDNNISVKIFWFPIKHDRLKVLNTWRWKINVYLERVLLKKRAQCFSGWTEATS